MTGSASKKPTPVAPIRAEVAAKLYARPVAQRPKAPRSKANPAEAPTPITVGQVFRTAVVLLVGLAFAPLSQIEGAPPAAPGVQQVASVAQ